MSEDYSGQALLRAGAGPLTMLALSIADEDSQHDSQRVDGRPSHGDYVRCVGDTFTAVGSGHRYKVELQRIDKLPAVQRESCRIGLTMRPRGRRAMPAGDYVLRHRGVPTHRLRLAPFGADGRMLAVVDERN